MDLKDILLVSDYDNTMTGENHLVPENNLEAIRNFTEEGGAFTIASGRGKREWYSSFREVPFNAPLILSNGATIYDTEKNQVLYHALLTETQKELASKLFLSLPEGCAGLIEAEEIVYIPEEVHKATGFEGFPGSNPRYLPLKEIPADWDKVSYISTRRKPSSGQYEIFDFSALDTFCMDLLERQAEDLGISGIRSLPIMYEIPPEGIDKGVSARRLLKLLNKKVLVCVGDAPNDLAMLKEADICFVPQESILVADGLVPEGAILTVKCEKGSLADAIRILKSL